MKRILIILLISLLVGPIYSQPFGDAIPGYRVVRINYENTRGARETTSFRYDKFGKISKAIWMVNDKSRYSTNYYEYDLKGNLISAFRDFSDGVTSFERFNYDASGNKVSEYFYRSDSVSGFAFHVYSNQLIQSNLFNHKGWLNGNLYLQYNRNKKKEKGFLTKENDTICKVYYSYDSIGNLTREFWDFNGKSSQTFNYTYEKIDSPLHFYSSPYLFGNNNFRIKNENYTFNNEKGGPSIYYYNEQNLLARKVFIRSDNLTVTTLYGYDDERKLVTSERVFSDSSTERFTYTYDENKNLVFRNSFKGDTLFGFESYLYNSENVLTKAYLKNFDGWLSGTINFKSEEFGKITSGEFTGENGFNASIVFYYNDENLLSKIKWLFSFGKFQEYSFEYEYFKLP